MTSASPDDLVVTFRSLPRRLREAQADTPPERTAGATSALHALLTEAGRLMGTGPDPAALGDAVAAVRADSWDDATLARLREIALEAGKFLRQIEAAGDSPD
jgi:hypothetical protein